MWSLNPFKRWKELLKNRDNVIRSLIEARTAEIKDGYFYILNLGSQATINDAKKIAVDIGEELKKKGFKNTVILVTCSDGDIKIDTKKIKKED